MDLFKVEGNVVKPTEHALMTHPYSEIWDRDETPDKVNAIRDLSYIEFCCSYKKSNPYKGYPEDRIKIEVGKAVYKEDYINFVEDDLIIGGIELYKKLRLEASPTLNYYLAAKEGAEKMVSWLKNFDIEKINLKTGNPLLKPREVTSALKDTYDVMKTLDSLQKKVYEEAFETVRTVANKEINVFEE